MDALESVNHEYDADIVMVEEADDLVVAQAHRVSIQEDSPTAIFANDVDSRGAATATATTAVAVATTLLMGEVVSVVADHEHSNAAPNSDNDEFYKRHVMGGSSLSNHYRRAGSDGSSLRNSTGQVTALSTSRTESNSFRSSTGQITTSNALPSTALHRSVSIPNRQQISPPSEQSVSILTEFTSAIMNAPPSNDAATTTIATNRIDESPPRSNEELPSTIPAQQGPRPSDKDEARSNRFAPKKYAWALVMIVVLVAIGVVSGLCGSGRCKRDSNESYPLRSATLTAIRKRGRLNCGIPDGIPLEEIDVDSSIVRFNVALCKAIAAAIFGDGTTHKTLSRIRVNPSNRFVMLQNGAVDVLLSSTTHTMERQVFEPTTGAAFSFSTPYLYGGLTFGGTPPFDKCALDYATNASGSSNSNDCDDMRVCVVSNTTFETTVKRLFNGTRYQLIPTVDTDELYRKFSATDGERCNVIAGDVFETATNIIPSTGYGYRSYGVSKTLFSREPLAMVTRQNDRDWSDFVNWIVLSLIPAEYEAVTTDVFAQAFGDEYRHVFERALAVAKGKGDYSDLYADHLQRIVERQDVNEIVDPKNSSGLMYAMPLGNHAANGPDPAVGGTLFNITQRKRQRLRCGVSKRPIFSEFNATGRIWSGFDVDFCRALSAALFGGDGDKVDFMDLNASECFVALHEGKVDVLSRATTITLQTDLFEPTVGAGFTFSQPNFFRSGSSGGIPAAEPSALVTRQDDHQWSAFVYWVVSATLYAEENEISSATASEMPEVNLFGRNYSNMFKHAIAAVGSYAEIYERNVQAYLNRSGLNELNGIPPGPQHYQMPSYDA